MTPPEWTVGANEVLASGGAPLDPLQTDPAGFWIPHVASEKREILSMSSQSQLNHLCVVIGNEDSPGVKMGDVHCFGDPNAPGMFGTSIGADGKLNSTMRFNRVKTSEKVTCATTPEGQLHCVWISPALNFTELDNVPLPDVGLGTTYVTDFAIGTNHICVILNDRGLYCWGDNTQNQLATGANTPISLSQADFSAGTAKINLTGLTEFLKVYASDNQTCAIGIDEAMYCWGRNQPAQKISTTGWQVTSASLGRGDTSGLGHNCMVYNTTAPPAVGKVACAGSNHYGQLGRGSISAVPPYYEPTLATVQKVGAIDLDGVIEISVGEFATCAIDTTGSTWCWGRNQPALKEIDQATDGSIPLATLTRNPSAGKWVALGNEFTCVARADDRLTCTGKNIFQNAQEGSGASSLTTFIDSSTVLGPHFFGESPGSLPGAPRLQPLASNGTMSCASLTSSNGGVECWGQWYDPTLTKHTRAVPIQDLDDQVSSISIGMNHACAVKRGSLWCWGDNSQGQINGDTLINRYPSPQQIFQTGVTAVAAGAEHTCAIVSNNVVCWGGNSHGQVGAGRYSRLIPYPVIALQGPIVGLTAGNYHTCAIQAGTPNRTYCWGQDNMDQLGLGVGDQGTPNASLVTMVLNYEPLDIVAGWDHTCVKATHDTQANHYRLICWGSNNAGEMGSTPSNPAFSSTYPAPTVITASNLSAINPIAAAGDNTCFILQDGAMERVYCMGDNQFGQTGYYPEIGTRVSFAPKLVLSFNIGSNLAHLAPGYSHLCYNVGGVFCIGNNTYGQLGNGKDYELKVPDAVQVLPSDVIEVALGERHTCALKSNGDLHCWGYNRDGVNELLPNIVDEFQVDPAMVVETGVEHIAAFAATTCFSKAGEVRCWGSNNNGILGVDPIATPWLSYNDSIAGAPILTGSGTIRGIFMSASKACALDGLDLKCWGDNTGESIAVSPAPALIASPVTVASQVEHAIVSEWGICYAGTGPLNCHVTPGNIAAGTLKTNLQSANIESIQDLSTNPFNPLLCATTTDGFLYCGGDNSNGVLNGYSGVSSNLAFERIHDDTHKFSMSFGHVCSDIGATVSCFGSDGLGQIGNGDEDFSSQASYVPVEFP